MNINSYASYSNPLLNTYTPASNNSAENQIQSTTSPSQDTLKQVSQTQQSSSIGNDFNVNISQEARENSSNTAQPTNTPSRTLETTSTTQPQQTQQIEQEQQTQQLRQTQQTQQMQSQFYQSSPYAGQIPVSRANIDLMA
ncbi:MAG: hypothetical protein HQK62_04455 [Desulfamplus sp.]|nr:hypothetical protein [Desulfamplus sp.]